MSNYFRKVPDLAYVSRLPNAKIGDYIIVKNRKDKSSKLGNPLIHSVFAK